MSSAATTASTAAASTAGSGGGEGAEEAAKDSADIAAFFRSGERGAGRRRPGSGFVRCPVAPRWRPRGAPHLVGAPRLPRGGAAGDRCGSGRGAAPGGRPATGAGAEARAALALQGERKTGGGGARRRRAAGLRAPSEREVTRL